MREAAVIASYNVHGGIGIDRRFAPDRIANVLNEIDADIVALQEIASCSGADFLQCLRDATGMHAIAGPTMRRAESEFGNGLLTRFPVVSVDHLRLDVRGREPRAAIDAVLGYPGAPLRVIVTHLGLKPSERREQVMRLLDRVRDGKAMPTVLIGDLNEWFLRGRPLRWLHEHFGESPVRATYPSLLPLLALDRIWTAPAAMLQTVRAHRSRIARIASDHLPLVARIAWNGDEAPVG